jgi:hypothetical protein
MGGFVVEASGLETSEVKEALSRLDHEKALAKDIESEARDAEDKALLLEASVLKHERRAEAGPSMSIFV